MGREGERVGTKKKREWGANEQGNRGAQGTPATRSKERLDLRETMQKEGGKSGGVLGRQLVMWELKWVCDRAPQGKAEKEKGK